MCPCISSKGKYATCSRYYVPITRPSVFERENYCFSLYELCPVFSGGRIDREATTDMIGIDYKNSDYD